MIASVSGSEIRDGSGRKIGSVQGDDIRDESGRRIGSLDDARRAVEGGFGGTTLAAVWMLFVR